jgi:tRNA nucleotidyltransferase/poly(A) polymerase
MEKLFSFYEVGGKVRDEILGLQSKDVDYTVVPSDSLLEQYTEAEEMFEILVTYLRETKFEIFLITPDCFTIRAMFPKDHKYSGVADFVMARREVGYIPGTRTPIVKPGTLYDDLMRRDATLNALAKDEDGTIIDYFGGLEDLTNRVLRTPLEPIKTFDDDALRIIRFIRFSITKGFSIPNDITNVIRNYDYESKMGVVSTERIREELFKCFKFNTLKTLHELNRFPDLRDYIFKNNLLWLKPTMEQ